MVLPDFDDDCLDLRSDAVCRLTCCTKTMKYLDMTAKPPFETYESYYPEYKQCCPGTVFLLVVIFATLVHVGLLGVLFLQSESVVSVFYLESIPRTTSYNVDESLGIQIYPGAFAGGTSTGLLASGTQWENMLHVQFIQCTVSGDSGRTCTNLGWKYCASGNGICPLDTSGLSMMNQLYAEPYTIVAALVSWCNSTDIPFNGTTSDQYNSTNCSYTEAQVSATLHQSAIEIRTLNSLPSNIENSFLKDAYTQLTNVIDGYSVNLGNYYFFPFNLKPLTSTHIDSGGLISGPGDAAILVSSSFQSASAASILSTGTSSSSVSLNGTYAYLQFSLLPTIRDYTVDEKLALTLLAHLGSWFVLVYIASLIIKMITMRLYWSNRGDEPLQRDKDTEQFLQAVTNTEPKELEDKLLYAITLGGTKKFGWQTKHLFGYYQANSDETEYLKKIQGPLYQFHANRRIERGIKSQIRGADGKRRAATEEDEELRENLRRESDMENRKEMFVSMCLYHVSCEMIKLRELIATNLQGEAKEYGLEKRLSSLE
uniref:Uncharacterized protein n=1 Tax=Lotharella globosa TaxID=91324 RepID=A0A7S4DN58_9EUKA|mmetsp:Transcript_23307/g.45432  ORF Transcript_23307/g.45432 Transcript_23307/m.45432 type:complete len:541 (+) Transcript_23307:52-1674(+)